MTALSWLTAGETLTPAGLGTPALPVLQVPGPWLVLQDFVCLCALQSSWPRPQKGLKGLGLLSSWLVLPGQDHEKGVDRE